MTAERLPFRAVPEAVLPLTNAQPPGIVAKPDDWGLYRSFLRVW